MAQKILVVDDSATDAAAVSSSLRSAGYTTITARSGEEALTLLEQQRPDLVILDVIMPGKSGFQVCREIKRDARWADVPVVMLTSKNQEADRYWGLRQGASEYLTKPFQPAELVATVRRFV
jgi:DNA-binding response OmpR family regulator